jgi:mercuric ion transport protein
MQELPRAAAPPTAQSDAGALTGENLMAAGGLMAALATASCCVVPFALFLLGIGGAWIGNLTALAPYQPIFAAAALSFLGYGFYLVYRRPAATCAEGSYCDKPSSKRLAKAGLWVATVVVVTALVLPKAASLFL